MRSDPALFGRLRLAARLQRRVLAELPGASGERLLSLAESVGHLAWMSHGGAFAWPEAELALRDGPGLTGAASRLDTQAVRGRTLHVLSTIYATGGHTRLAQRWMELMDSEPAAVLLTRQTGVADRAWICPEGREVPVLDLESEGIRTRLDKLAATRTLMEAAAKVVLHIHPDDAPSVAAGHQCQGTPITFLNHADHVAWLGAALPASLLGGRNGGSDLAVRRRGTDPSMCSYVPLPLTPPPVLDRASARRDLGFRDDEVVMLTVASGYKYLPVGGQSLLDPLDAVLGHPGLRLVVIGPDPTHPVFGELARRHPDRISILGIVPRPDVYRAAADLYLDSFPFCSTTSLLESAQLGTPVVAYQPEPAELGIFYSDWPTIPRAWFAAETPEAFTDRVRELVQRHSLRQELGDRLREGTRLHLPGPWQEALAAHDARVFSPGPWEGCPAPQEGPLDQILSGLGSDPARFPKVSRIPLGWWGRAGVVADRWRRVRLEGPVP